MTAPHAADSVNALDTELSNAHATVTRQYEVVTCWRTIYLPAEMWWVPMPPDMLNVLRSSTDFSVPEAGQVPTVLLIAGEDEIFELTAYRARSNGELYMLIPQKAAANE